jgi:putative membrane protein
MVGKGLAGLGGGALGLLLAIRIADGSYAALVQGWYEPVLIGTALLLLLLAAIVSFQVLRGGGRWRPQFRIGAVAMIGLAAIPILLGLVYQPQPLSSASLETLQDGGRSSLQFSSTAAGSDPSRRNIYQWAYEFAHTEPAELLGDPVDVIGFAYHAADQPEGVFQVARFVVACCVADARGYMLPVRWSDAESLRNDTWVHVTGRIGTAPDGSLIVLADAVETIEAPANPYIYP